MLPKNTNGWQLTCKCLYRGFNSAVDYSVNFVKTVYTSRSVWSSAQSSPVAALSFTFLLQIIFSRVGPAWPNFPSEV